MNKRRATRWTPTALAALVMLCASGHPPASAGAPPAQAQVPTVEAAVQALLDACRVPPGADGVARVRYGALTRDRARLDRALGAIAAARPDDLPSPAARQAFWYNTYNTLMIDAVVRAWGSDPAWSVSREDFAVFKRREHTAAGKRLTLDEIEHVVLRGKQQKAPADAALSTWLGEQHRSTWQGAALDPRLHVALNCASVGCPSLSGRAFSAAELDAQLSALTRAYVSDPLRGAGPSGISSLFRWYGEDFQPQGVEAFVKRHHPAPQSVRVGVWLDYDWSLNVSL